MLVVRAAILKIIKLIMIRIGRAGTHRTEFVGIG